MRVHVLLGQFGYMFSPGFAAFAERLKGEFPGAEVQTWNPHDWQSVVRDVHDNEGPFVLLGYSLGGNAVTWAAANIDKDIALAAVYDATVNGPVYPLGDNFKRVLCYVNTLWDFFGRATVEGPNVEVTMVHIPHLMIQGSEELHQMTIAAMRQVEEDDNGRAR